MSSKEDAIMLSSEILKLETENQELKEMLRILSKDTSKPKDCRHCKYYIQYYCRDNHGNFRTIYAGHCICGVPSRKRNGKRNPTPEETCLCYEGRGE